MTREEYLKEIGKQLYDARLEEKEAKDNVSQLREQFFDLWDDGLRGKDHLLPIRTIEVPDTFWTRTGMSKEDFVASRFPGWDVEHIERNIATGITVFVFKRNPKFISGVVDIEVDEEGKILRVSKDVAEYTPEIDWDTLRDERPDLFASLATPVPTYEINEMAFDKMVSEHPEELATLQRHMKVKTPTLRATAKKVKSE